METVLVADDDDDLLEMYDVWLSEEEWTIRTATDGDEALAVLDETVDVAVLDRRMPNTPGDEVARRIRSSATECKIVIVSACQRDDGIDERLYDTYLTKPVQMSTFVGEVESQLESPLAVDQ